MNIKLKVSFAGNESIEQPSGQKITAKSLEQHKTYLHRNMLFIRTIIRIEKDEVIYNQFNRLGVCSTQHFAASCPTEATPAEIVFLYTKGNKFNRSLNGSKANCNAACSCL